MRWPGRMATREGVDNSHHELYHSSIKDDSKTAASPPSQVAVNDGHEERPDVDLVHCDAPEEIDNDILKDDGRCTYHSQFTEARDVPHLDHRSTLSDESLQEATLMLKNQVLYLDLDVENLANDSKPIESDYCDLQTTSATQSGDSSVPTCEEVGNCSGEALKGGEDTHAPSSDMKSSHRESDNAATKDTNISRHSESVACMNADDVVERLTNIFHGVDDILLLEDCDDFMKVPTSVKMVGIQQNVDDHSGGIVNGTGDDCKRSEGPCTDCDEILLGFDCDNVGSEVQNTILGEVTDCAAEHYNVSHPSCASFDQQNDTETLPKQPSSSSTQLDDSLHINSLPIEILHRIFSFMAQFDLCTCAAPVCRMWRDMAYDPIYWQELDLGYNCRISPENFYRCISRMPRLKTLNLCWQSDISCDYIMFVGEYCPKLADINLGFCESIDKFVVTSIRDSLKELQCMNLEGCSLIDDGCILLLSELPCLHTLNLSHCTRVTDIGITSLSQRLHTIKHLNLDGIATITDSAVVSLVKLHGEQMVHLDLDGAELTDECLAVLRFCSSLKHLTFSFAELLTDGGLPYLTEMKSLEYLRLKKGLSVSAGALCSMFSTRRLTNLRHLDLTECTELRDEAVDAFVKCCGKTLRTLALCWCWHVTDVGISDILYNCRQLQELDLMGLDKIYGTDMREIPKLLPDLTRLNLQQCNIIRDEIIEDIVREMPKLIAFNYYGEEFRNRLVFE